MGETKRTRRFDSTGPTEKKAKPTPDDETDELDPSVATDSQDERDTPEDYLAMTKAALLANEAMRRKEASLPAIGATPQPPSNCRDASSTPPTNLAEALGIPAEWPRITQAAPAARPVPHAHPGTRRAKKPDVYGADGWCPKRHALSGFFNEQGTPNNTRVARPAPPAGAAQYIRASHRD